MQEALHIRTTVLPGGKVEFASPELESGRTVDVVVRRLPASQHHHVHFRTPDGGERVIPKRYRSLASEMRTVKQVGDTVTLEGVQKTDFTVDVEPCGDRWSDCRYSSD
ncbi:MAG: hypothetical protein OXD46_00440 [Chloroflexi bacterium]|nr:hypothetical protein [Chloroflexota bacterium]